MTRETEGLVVSVLGVMALRLTVTDTYLSYLRPAMRWPLLGSGVALLALGLATLAVALRAPAGDREAREHPVRVGWLLLVPVLVIFLVAPAPLGAYAAARDDTRSVAHRTSFAPLPPASADGAVELSINELNQRALYDSAHSLDGRTIRLVGFVVQHGAPLGSFFLTRFVITCCAADAFPVHVSVVAPSATSLPDDTWVEVVGSVRAGGTPTVAIDPVSVSQVPAPSNTYE